MTHYKDECKFVSHYIIVILSHMALAVNSSCIYLLAKAHKCLGQNTRIITI
jgi:hypothetical protein